VRGRGLYPWFRSYYFQDDIEGTEEDALYHSNRGFPPEERDGGYKIPLPKAFYRLSFHYAKVDRDRSHLAFADMAEIEKLARGPRRFDILVEGEVVRENFDPLREVGFATADVFSVTKDVTDGILEIKFRPRVGDPQISAIEIERLKDAR
jgi:hypothetical protein